MTVHPAQVLPAASLKEADYNPRLMPPAELVALVRSIREFGLVAPLVVRAEDRLLLGGHQRLAALRLVAQEGGLDPAALQVPAVLVSGLSDARAKLLNLGLNKIGGEWDYAKLAELLADLGARLDPAQVSASGFSPAEVEDIVALMGAGLHPSAPAPDDAEPEVELVLDVATDADAAFCQGALQDYGMAGPSSSAAALLAACKRAQS